MRIVRALALAAACTASFDPAPLALDRAGGRWDGRRAALQPRASPGVHRPDLEASLQTCGGADSCEVPAPAAWTSTGSVTGPSGADVPNDTTAVAVRGGADVAALTALYAHGFGGALSFGMTIPVLPYLATSLGATGRDMGTLASLYSVGTLLTSAVAGPLSDRRGRRPVVVTLQFSHALALLIVSRARSLAVLQAARFLTGVSVQMSVSQAVVRDVASPASRPAVLGRFAVAGAAGLMVGPPLGAFLLTAAQGGGGGAADPYRVVMALASCVSAASAAVTLLCLSETRQQGPAASSAAASASGGGIASSLFVAPGYALTLAAAAALRFMMAVTYTIYPLVLIRLHGYTAQQLAGTVFKIAGASAVAQAVLIAPLVKHLGAAGAGVGALSTAAAAVFVLSRALGRSPALCVGATMVASVAGNIGQVVLTALASTAAPEGRAGEALGLKAAFEAGAGIAAPLLAGRLFDVDPAAPFVMAAAAGLLGVLPAALLAVSGAGGGGAAVRVRGGGGGPPCVGFAALQVPRTSASDALLRVAADAKQAGKAVILPGVYDALSAKVFAPRAAALYLSGFGVTAASLGMPDAGLVTASEMERAVGAVVDAAGGTPVVADADTGFGGLANIRRTVRGYAKAGAAALTIEDQTFPKRCGYAQTAVVVSEAAAVRRVAAACAARDEAALDFGCRVLVVARTDARASEGISSAASRCRAFERAGADVVYAEGLETDAECASIRASIATPTILAQVEGAGPVRRQDEAGALGFEFLLAGITSLQATAAALEETADAMYSGGHGGLAGQSVPLATLEELKTLVGWGSMAEWEEAF